MSFDEEDSAIVLKPSVELIPDEYFQQKNADAAVHIFIFREGIEKKFVDCMRSLDYSITNENVHYLTNRKAVLATFDKIAGSTANASSLIILFWGLFKADRKFLLKDGSSIKLTDIWSKFMSNNCPSLIDKPKIFIFNGVKHFEGTEEDALRINSGNDQIFAYNIPLEADILIVFKQNNDLESSIDYMNSLCSNFENYSQREDISSLLTIAHFTNQPTLISTMTRKFFLKPSSYRGKQLAIMEKYDKIDIEINNLKDNIIYLTKKEKKNNKEPNAATSSTYDSTIDNQKAASVGDDLPSRTSTNSRFHSRSNTTSRLIEIDKILHRNRRTSITGDHRPAWKY